MNFKIKNISFHFSNNHLKVNNMTIECNKNTFQAIQLFLNSKNSTISKHHLMEYIWGTVIVSDNSIFKLVQNIRSIFIDAGLPEDTIENVYGKGYQIKHLITEIGVSDNNTTKVGSKNFKLLLSLTIIIMVSLLIINHYSNNNSKQKDSLKPKNKKYISSLLKSDWDKGLIYINEQLKNKDDKLSKTDLALFVW